MIGQQVDARVQYSLHECALAWLVPDKGIPPTEAAAVLVAACCCSSSTQHLGLCSSNFTEQIMTEIRENRENGKNARKCLQGLQGSYVLIISLSIQDSRLKPGPKTQEQVKGKI